MKAALGIMKIVAALPCPMKKNFWARFEPYLPDRRR
jgi:hypothetical protein